MQTSTTKRSQDSLLMNAAVATNCTSAPRSEVPCPVDGELLHSWKEIAVYPAALLAMSLAIASGTFAQNYCVHPRMISVTGTSEIKVAPDEVTLFLGVESRDKDLAVAKANNDKSIKNLLSLAHNVGIDAKDIQTSALNMGPKYSEEKTPRFLGYEVSQTISLTLKDISKYE